MEVLLYSSIRTSFYAVTPSNLSDKAFAWACSFSLYWISSSRVKVFLSKSFSILSFYLLSCFLFFLRSLRWLVYLLNFQFYYLFNCLVLLNQAFKDFSIASADYLCDLICSYSLWSWAASLLSFQQLNEVESQSIFAFDILAANQFNIFLSCINKIIEQNNSFFLYVCIYLYMFQLINLNKYQKTCIAMSSNFILKPNENCAPLQIQIQVCSDCKKHSWYTWHRQQNYLGIAIQIQKAIAVYNQQAQVDIYKVGAAKVGAFEISCNGVLLFSKIKLGYFPRISAFMSRLMSFVDDLQNGRDLTMYTKKQKSRWEKSQYEKSSRTTIFRPNSSRSTRRGITFRVRVNQQEREKMQRKICKTQQVHKQNPSASQSNLINIISKTDNNDQIQAHNHGRQEQNRVSLDTCNNQIQKQPNAAENKKLQQQKTLQTLQKTAFQEKEKKDQDKQDPRTIISNQIYQKRNQQPSSNIGNEKMKDYTQKQQHQQELVKHKESDPKQSEVKRSMTPDNLLQGNEGNLNPQSIENTKAVKVEEGNKDQNQANFIL